jgi:hypothetical protein
LHILKFLFQDGFLAIASKGFNFCFGGIVLAFCVQGLWCGKLRGCADENLEAIVGGQLGGDLGIDVCCGREG